MKPVLAAAIVIMVSGLASCATYMPAPLDVHAIAAPTVHDLPANASAGDLLRLALARDPAVAAARASVAAAEASRKAAKNLPPLSLSLTAEYSKDANAQKPWLFGGAVGIPLDIGAKRAARITAADLVVVKARYALGEAVWAARQRLFQALDDVALSEQEIALNQTMLDQRQAYHDVIARRVAHGAEAQGLAAQAALDVSGARQGLEQAKAKHIQAVAALARALDADPQAVAGLKVDTDGAAPDEAQLDAMLEAAVYNRGDVLTAVADYDTAENDLRQAVAARYPDITIQPGYTWERGDVKVPLGLSLTLPPLDGNRSAIAAAQSARLAAGKTLEDKVKSVHSDAIKAAGMYRADLATAVAMRDIDLPASQEMAQRVQRSMAAGESDRGEALLAQINATQTQINLLQAEWTARGDRLALEDALHQAFDPVQTQILTEEVQK